MFICFGRNNVLEFSRETELMGYTCMIYPEVLVHTVMATEKSHDLLSMNWRPGRLVVSSARVQRSENQEHEEQETIHVFAKQKC